MGLWPLLGSGSWGGVHQKLQAEEYLLIILPLLTGQVQHRPAAAPHYPWGKRKMLVYNYREKTTVAN